MTHHERKGFQRTFTNDIYHIEKQLQEYDELLYIMWNPNTGEWLIMDGLMDAAVMKIPQIGFETLDSRLIEHIKKIHTYNGFSAIHEIEEYEARKQREEEKKLEDLSYHMAKDLQKPLKEAFMYGRTTGTVKDTIVIG